MHTINDDDLVLYHYGDGLDAARAAEIRDALAASANLRERYASLERVLARVDAEPVPEPDANFNARLWQKLEPRLQTRRVEKRAPWRDALDTLHAWLTPPRLAFAGACAIALAVGLGFYAGRQSAPNAPLVASAAADAASARVLDAYVAAHLRATEGVLMTASNSDSADLLGGNRELAAQLVEANRLYALAAARAGNTQLADFLRQIEPVLISLANPSPSESVQPSEGLREYLKATDLMFQVRAAEARLDRNGTHRT
jgi:negative regulator of sigma E activity